MCMVQSKPSITVSSNYYCYFVVVIDSIAQSHLTLEICISVHSSIIAEHLRELMFCGSSSLSGNRPRKPICQALRWPWVTATCFPYCDLVREQLQFWLLGRSEDSRVEKAETSDGNVSSLWACAERDTVSSRDLSTTVPRSSRSSVQGPGQQRPFPWLRMPTTQRWPRHVYISVWCGD